ncbi:hypothetical protein RU01_21770 [Rhodococcus sp. MEB064]|nr:hypothetical protein RU01_21770 [Rhodococcus sp. MEB064]
MSEGLADLEAELTGALMVRGAPGFEAEVATFNSSLLHTPLIIVCAETVADVQAAVRYATKYGVQLGVHATGHGYTSFTDGLMVSVRRLNSMTLDVEGHLVTVGAGVRWREVLEASAPHGLSPLAGSSTDVGVVGYLLGSGIAITGRAFGFGTDRVIALEMVTLDGEFRKVDAITEPDLFWGLRGGGGNLGIVTSVTFELVELASFYGGGIYFDGTHVRDVLSAYASWTTTLVEEMCTSLALVWLPPDPSLPEPLRGKLVAHLRVVYLGSESDGDEILAPMRASGPVLLDSVTQMAVTAMDDVHGDPPSAIPFYARGTLFGDINDDTIDAMLSVVGPDVAVPMLMWDLRHQGGAFSREPAVPNAICGRDAAFNWQVVGLATPECVDAVQLVVDQSITATEPWSTGHTLVNLHGAVKDDVDRARAFDSAGYDRMVELVRRYDPQGLLRHGHSIARSVGQSR